jgi:hypothetical protein
MKCVQTLFQEQRISPSLGMGTQRLVTSVRHVLDVLVQGLKEVKGDNAFIFNGTRYVIMQGVREQLQDIAKANDMVYGRSMMMMMMMM